MKNKMLDKMIASVLNIRKDFDFELFKKVWGSAIKNRSTPKSLCANIERIRKSYGNGFKEKYNDALSIETRLKNKESSKDLDLKIEPDLKKVIEMTRMVSDFLCKELSLDNKALSKFDNPFSMAQLFTILETDTNGFASTCKAVTLENNYRMQTSGIGQGGALCCRLPAESVRPFDGSLGKILDRQAYEIAKIKTKELLQLTGLKNRKLKINILVEQNSFEFSSSIATIKKSEKAKKLQKMAKDESEIAEKRWKSKEERLESDSHNICAYTGISINKQSCEIDHIIPRSDSLNSDGTIFNSEFNLIRVSIEGNQKKLEAKYFLEMLNARYLKSVFNTASVDVIRSLILDQVEKIAKYNPTFNIDIMTDFERQCCRHALFLRTSEKAFQLVTAAISKQGKTQVNGTQAWFIKAIISKLNKNLEKWKNDNNVEIEYNAFKLSPVDNSRFRRELGKIDSTFEKKEIQPITSHAIDAMCLYGVATMVPCISKEISDVSGQMQNLYDARRLREIIPDSYDVVSIHNKDFIDKDTPESKQLFKDTIYGEDFLHIMVRDRTVRIGFDWGNNSIEVVSGGDKLLDCLSDYLISNNKSKSIITYSVCKFKAFDLLHKFYKNETDSDEDKICKCLNVLHYTTLQKDVFSSLFDEQKKSFFKADEIINNRNTEISLKSSDFPKEFKIKLSMDKKIVLPSINEWRSIINEFEAYIGKKDDTGNGKEKLDNFIRAHLKKSKSSKVSHIRSRRLFSLPLLDNPSGGIRIRRTNDNNESIYQLVAANTPVTSANKGFATDDNGKVLWANAVPADAYADGQLTLLGAQTSSSSFEKMNNERLVFSSMNPSYLKIFMSPSSTDRRTVVIEQEFQVFVKCIGETGNYKTYHDLPSEIKLNNPEKFAEIINNQICGKPRGGKIKLQRLGNIVVYRYTVESSNSVMKDSYNNPLIINKIC